MPFLWRHQVDGASSPCFDFPPELLQYSDTYFEDYAFHIQSKDPAVYRGMVQTVGVRQCHPDYRFLNRISSRYSLHYILSGKAWVGNQSVGEGDVIFFDRNQIHNFSADAQEPCHYAWITFKGSGCSQLMLQSGFRQNMIFKTENMTEISKIFYEMLYEDHPRQQVDLFFDSCLYKLISYSVPNKADVVPTQPRRKNAADAHIENALFYIRLHHTDHNFQIENIGPEIGLNNAYFRKLFKQQTGFSPKQYLIRYRIEAATTLLLSSNLPIAEIATTVGFHDYRHFFENFRRQTGQAPGELRANHEKRKRADSGREG